MIHAHLAWPLMVLALPLPLLMARWLKPATPSGAVLFLPFAATVGSQLASANRPHDRWRQGLKAAVWLLLVLAAMRPQWLDDPQAQPSNGRRVLLAVDISGSMETADMANGQSRLDVVKHVAGDFIGHRQGDQVGLILFGSQPYLQAPLTADLATANQFLQEAQIGMAGTETAIGDAIGLAIKRLRGGNSAPLANTLLILLTDGGNNAGTLDPAQAAQLAAKGGLRIYTIGVGAAVQQGFLGTAGNTDLDESTLKAIADQTGGRYFRATDQQALAQVYQAINQLEPASGANQWYRPAIEYFAWPLALALLLSVPLILAGGRSHG